jgi:hypothetical protein
VALIACVECGKEISDKAPACPHCGRPVAVESSFDVLSANSIGQKIPISHSVKRKISAGGWLLIICLPVILAFGGWKTFSILHEANKPSLPVAISWRKALIGPGLVLHVHNKSDRQLSLLGVFENATLHNKRAFRIDVPAGGDTELGHLEGWVFSSGDSLQLSHADYRTWNLSAP